MVIPYIRKKRGKSIRFQQKIEKIINFRPEKPDLARNGYKSENGRCNRTIESESTVT